MTAPRHPGKPLQSRLYLAFLGAAMLLAGILAPPSLRAAGAPPPLVVNDLTGLAISGFDPVAYFTDKSPKGGRPDLELALGGVVWRFRNEGNRAAFAEHLDVYTPQFGGYDPVAIARDASVPGHPLFWAVTGERLYLFYSEKARTEFLADPASIIARATRKWPTLARAIAR
jgi:hypothetical protein